MYDYELIRLSVVSWECKRRKKCMYLANNQKGKKGNLPKDFPTGRPQDQGQGEQEGRDREIVSVGSAEQAMCGSAGP